jgi:hypothetical protein
MFIPLRRRGLSRRLASIGLILQTVGLIGLAISPSLAVAALAVGVVGIGFALCFPVLTGTLQAGVPYGLRGRVMSYHTLSHLGNRPFAALGAGAVASLLGARAGVVGAILLAPIGLIAIRIAMRQLDAESASPVGVATVGLRGRR